VAHACNPSYSGGRDQEDCGSKPAQENSSQDSSSKKVHHQNGAVEVAQGEGPEFKIQYCKNKAIRSIVSLINYLLLHFLKSASSQNGFMAIISHL
jgi:hypothetical protein